MLTVACVWVKSETYTRDWVLRLYGMVRRNLDRPFRFVCLTPHMNGEFYDHPYVECVRPTIDPPKGARPWWYKVNLFTLLGERVLYLDLDVAVLRGLAPMVDYPSDFVMCQPNCTPIMRGDPNSSVMVWSPDGDQVRVIRQALPPPYDRFAGDQQWLATLDMRVDLFPARWVSKYYPKRGVRPPEPGTIVSLLIQGGKNAQLIADGHGWIADYWR